MLSKGKLKTLTTRWFSEQQDSYQKRCLHLENTIPLTAPASYGHNRSLAGSKLGVTHTANTQANTCSSTHLHSHMSSHQLKFEFDKGKGLRLWISLKIWDPTCFLNSSVTPSNGTLPVALFCVRVSLLGSHR